MEKELSEKEKWIIKAENDLKIIAKDLASSDPITDIICFHAQQASENKGFYFGTDEMNMAFDQRVSLWI